MPNDTENQLTSVSGGASASFVYDGDGQRVKTTFGSSTIAYVGDYFEWKGSTSTMVKYYYAGGRRIAMRVGTSTVYYLLLDHLGSTAITANASGSRVAELRYYAYGGTRYTYGTTPTAYHFTGQRLDDSTGLYYYGARYYDAALGRFVQADTIVPEPGNPQDLNRYSYVRNNPVLYRDPSGHAVCVDTECAWIVHPVTGEIRQRAPTNSPPESPQAYSPAESYQEAMGLFNEFRSNEGPFVREFGPTSSLTQDIMHSSGIREFHRVWAEEGYPLPFEWKHHLDVQDPREGPYPVRFIKSLPVYIGAQVKLARTAVGRRSTNPEGPIDAVDGTIGSLDTIRVKRAGSGWVKVEVENKMNWYSGLRVPGGDYSLWKTLDSLKVPGSDSTLGDAWVGIVGGSYGTKQTFYWWEPMPRSR